MITCDDGRRQAAWTTGRRGLRSRTGVPSAGLDNVLMAGLLLACPGVSTTRQGRELHAAEYSELQRDYKVSMGFRNQTR